MLILQHQQHAAPAWVVGKCDKFNFHNMHITVALKFHKGLLLFNKVHLHLKCDLWQIKYTFTLAYTKFFKIHAYNVRLTIIGPKLSN